MSISYPNPRKYKVQQSQIRYRYNHSQKIQRKALNYLFAWKTIQSFHTVKCDILIDTLQYFQNIIIKWDQQSKTMNGWTSCFLMIKSMRKILNALKKKFGYYSKDIKFSNIEKLYQITEIKNPKIIPINNLLFGLMIAAAQHPSPLDFTELQSIIEVIAQKQLLYLIANYSSRNNRPYRLPWETIDDPIIEYRKKYLKKRAKIVEYRKKLQPDYKQSKIHHYFKRKPPVYHDDAEILEILQFLDNGDDSDGNDIIKEPPRKKQRTS